MKYKLLFYNIIICFYSFLGLYFLKYDKIIPTQNYLILFTIYIVFLTFFSIYYRKIDWFIKYSFRKCFKSILFSYALNLLFITIIISLTDLRSISRLFLLGIIIIPFIIEVFIIILKSYWLYKNKLELDDKDILTNNKSSFYLNLKWLIFGFSLLIGSFLLMIRFKLGSFGYYNWSEQILLLLIVAWIISIFLTYKYWYYPSHNIYYHITPFIKSIVIMFIFVGLVTFFFRLESFSRVILYGTIAFYGVLEISIYFFIFIIKKESIILQNDEVHNNGNGNIFGQEKIINEKESNRSAKYLTKIKSLFQRIIIENKKEILQFLLNNIDANYEKKSITIFSTVTIENISILEDQSKNLLINLHKLNDIRRLNQYFIKCNDKIKPGGYLFGNFLPLEQMENKLQSKMPKVMYLIIFPFHFLFYRILPKLPKICHIYFMLTKGKNRVISRAEILGRLSFCGYEIIAEKIIDNSIYFIAKRAKTLSTEITPSYGPIVYLKRVGFNKKIIHIYKLRTMHPYSEFIQKDLFEKQKLDSSGKFKDDFRITSWGRIFRKLWIDELPQLINWMRGDVTLVGVRALSEQYFSLYTKELQDLRTKVKPGLLPPYYADLPNSFDAILNSERKYILEKLKKPFITDIKYFFKVIYNIIFRGARSK